MCFARSEFTDYNNKSSNWNIIVMMIAITVLLGLMFQFCKQ